LIYLKSQQQKLPTQVRPQFVLETGFSKNKSHPIISSGLFL